MKTDLSIAVVVLNWNGKTLLEEFLPSVVQFSTEATIYVADNASTDDSVSFLEKNFPSVKIIRNKINGGYARGYNDALQSVREDIFILLNSDVEVSENWLLPILEIFKNEPKTAAVQPKLLDYKKKNYFEYAGAAGGYVDKLGYPFCRGRIFDHLEEDHGQYNDDAYIFWASGACLAIRNEHFFEAQMFDEDFFAHQEEIDLCWRLYNLDYKIKFAANSRVYHLGGATLDAMNPRKTFLNFRNSLFCLIKNVAAPQVCFIVFFRLVLDGIAAIKFIFEGRFAHFYAIIQAHFSFYLYLKRMLTKRKNSKLKKKYAVLNSLVWNYFILKKQKFSNF